MSLAGIDLFKLNNGNTREMFEIISKSTIKTTEKQHKGHCGDFIVNIE